MKTKYKVHLKFGSCWYDRFFEVNTNKVKHIPEADASLVNNTAEAEKNMKKCQKEIYNQN